jgi:hypothetical protein
MITGEAVLMAKSGFSFDEKAFRRQMNKAVNEGVGKMASDLSTMLNRMSSEFKGRPTDEIKPVLQRRWHRVTDGKITDPELTDYAEKIAAGDRFKINAQKL